MLALDGLTGDSPRAWLVLTTRSANPAPRAFYESRRQVWRAIRRRWPAAEYAAVIEFTTGYGARSGGARRPHWNVLVKGVEVEGLPALENVVRRVWCERVDARPEAQFVGEVAEIGGLTRYLALHFLKESQAPPPGWRGHRFMCSRGYFPGTAAEAREWARSSLRSKRALWRAIAAGFSGELAESVAALELERAESQSWELVRVDASEHVFRGGRVFDRRTGVEVDAAS